MMDHSEEVVLSDSLNGVKNPSTSVVSRIFITRQGDLIVTDMWDEIHEMLTQSGAGFSEEH